MRANAGPANLSTRGRSGWRARGKGEMIPWGEASVPVLRKDDHIEPSTFAGDEDSRVGNLFPQTGPPGA